MHGHYVPMVAGVLAMTVAGCFVHHVGDEGAGPSAALEHDSRFVGDWHVRGGDGWALSATSTIYRLHAEGDVEVVAHREGHYFGGAAGAWQLEGRDVACTFGNRWWSDGPSVLHVDSRCEDGTVTVATLDFRSPEATNTTSPELVLVEPVGALPRWEGPQGGFYRCTDEPAACLDW